MEGVKGTVHVQAFQEGIVIAMITMRRAEARCEEEMQVAAEEQRKGVMQGEKVEEEGGREGGREGRKVGLK